MSTIVRATNWQNAIKPSDLISNDQIQVFLEREFRKRGYQYLRKRQTPSEAKIALGQIYYRIKKDELAQAIAACEFDPSLVRKGKEGLFIERYYRPIFSSRSISFYLSRYWIMKQVQKAAHGKPERAYAKWLVLHFASDNLLPWIGSGQYEQRFRYACEYSTYSTDAVISHLRKALDGMFKAARTFYHLNRGKGEEARDVSTFFMLTKLDKKFDSFWYSAKNSHRKEVDERLNKFKYVLDNLDISE